jgi:hypothetical protein
MESITQGDYTKKKNMEILRGQCLNCAAMLYSGGPNNTAPPAERIFETARALFEEAKKQNFLDW